MENCGTPTDARGRGRSPSSVVTVRHPILVPAATLAPGATLGGADGPHHHPADPVAVRTGADHGHIVGIERPREPPVGEELPSPGADPRMERLLPAPPGGDGRGQHGTHLVSRFHSHRADETARGVIDPGVQLGLILERGDPHPARRIEQAGVQRHRPVDPEAHGRSHAIGPLPLAQCPVDCGGGVGPGHAGDGLQLRAGVAVGSGQKGGERQPDAGPGDHGVCRCRRADRPRPGSGRGRVGCRFARAGASSLARRRPRPQPSKHGVTLVCSRPAPGSAPVDCHTPCVGSVHGSTRFDSTPPRPGPALRPGR